MAAVAVDHVGSARAADLVVIRGTTQRPPSAVPVERIVIAVTANKTFAVFFAIRPIIGSFSSRCLVPDAFSGPFLLRLYFVATDA